EVGSGRLGRGRGPPRAPRAPHGVLGEAGVGSAGGAARGRERPRKARPGGSGVDVVPLRIRRGRAARGSARPAPSGGHGAGAGPRRALRRREALGRLRVRSAPRVPGTTERGDRSGGAEASDADELARRSRSAARRGAAPARSRGLFALSGGRPTFGEKSVSVAPEVRRSSMVRSRPAEVTAVHTRLMRCTLAVDDCATYWQKADLAVSPSERAKVAFERRWFGTKSEARL